MRKFYKIPMTERVVKVNDTSLFQILHEQYPDLHNRELGRVELTYGGSNPGVMTPELEKIVNDYNEQTALLYKAMKVPQYIIAIKEDEEVKEISTKTVLSAGGLSSLVAARQVSQQEAYEYLDNTEGYIEKANQFFPKKEEKKCLLKRAFEVIIGKKDN